MFIFAKSIIRISGTHNFFLLKLSILNNLLVTYYSHLPRGSPTVVCGLRTGPLADRDLQIFLRTRIIRGPDDWNRLRTRTVRRSKPQ